MARTKLQTIAEKAVARAYGVPVEEIQAAVDNPEGAEIIGFTGFDWMSLITQMLQLLLESLGNCQANDRAFAAIRKPNLFARAVTRNRAQRIFAQGNPKFSNMGPALVAALEEESSGMDEATIVSAMSEVQNPNPYMVV